MARHLSHPPLERIHHTCTSPQFPRTLANFWNEHSSMWTGVSRKSLSGTNSWGTSWTLSDLSIFSQVLVSRALKKLLDGLPASGHPKSCQELHSQARHISFHLCLLCAAPCPTWSLQKAQKPQAPVHFQWRWRSCLPWQQTIKAPSKARVSISVVYVGAIKH